ncbi:MAG TPA: DUF3592 domain-containing protein [Verrucomicrobiae bacterium]|nr:DUF3592 domain-containing protein [Verrucomicrobiae bacterium]
MAKYLLLLFPILGIVLFVAGVLAFRRLRAQVAGFIRTTGKVTDNVPSAEGFAIVVEYVVGGKSFSITSAVERKRRGKQGCQLALLYDPANPSRAVLAEDHYVSANKLLAIGVALALLGSLIACF